MNVYIKRRIILAVLLSALVITLIAGIGIGVRRYLNYLKYSKIKMIEGRVKSGQGLNTSLRDNNISAKAAVELINILDEILDLRKLQIGDSYRIYLDKDGQIVKFIYEKSPIEFYFVVRGESGQLNAFIPAVYPSKKMVAKEFTIKSSLFEAMHKNNEDDALVLAFADIFAWDIDFYSYPRTGDKIKIYFEKYYLKDEFLKYGRIIAAQYIGRDTFDAVYFLPKKNREGYYTLKGKPVEKMFLKSPLKFTGRITSYFGRRRDPFTSRHGNHSGVDFAAYYGAPIVATSDGHVTYAGWRGGYGRLVIVRHSNGYSTYYGHCSKFLARGGSKVRQGQVIASVGSTGRSTGPHVHYEIRMRGRIFNPLKFNQPKRKPLKGEDLEDFKGYSKNIWKNIEGI
jgi:murein DD-endopeptidase MepM/ murein hydrolase activator NlpD